MPNSKLSQSPWYLGQLTTYQILIAVAFLCLNEKAMHLGRSPRETYESQKHRVSEVTAQLLLSFINLLGLSFAYRKYGPILLIFFHFLLDFTVEKKKYRT